MEFVLNDETIKNSHGFYLLNAGGDFSRFNENPVMLAHHDNREVIGKWKDLKFSDSKLIGTAEFDEDDEAAVRVKGKVERGYLKGASLGIIITAAEIRLNKVGEDMVEEFYVTAWELYEGSIVAIPSNSTALKTDLYVYDGEGQKIPDVKTHIGEIIKLSAKSNKPNIECMEKKQIELTAEAIVLLGLTGEVTGESISKAVLALGERVKELEAEQTKGKQERASALINLAIKEGRITADKKEMFTKLALENFEVCSATLAEIPIKQSYGGTIVPLGVSAIDSSRKEWTRLEWMKKDMSGLKELQKSNPEAYAALK